VRCDVPAKTPQARTHSQTAAAIISKTTDRGCAVLYSEDSIRLVPLALYANGTSSTRLLTSQTTHENPSSNNGKALREFVVVLVLTPDRDERRWKCEAVRLSEGANRSSQLYTRIWNAVPPATPSCEEPWSNLTRNTPISTVSQQMQYRILQHTAAASRI
jgi:hypothetical protein